MLYTHRQTANNPPKLLFLAVACAIMALGVWRIRTAESGARSANSFYERLPGRLHFEPWFMKLGGAAFVVLGIMMMIFVIVVPSPWT